MKREQKEPGLRQTPGHQYPKLELCLISLSYHRKENPKPYGIHAHVKKVKTQRAVTIVINQKQGQKEAPLPQSAPQQCSGPKRACPVFECWQDTDQLPRETPATRGSSEGARTCREREFPSPTSVQLHHRLQAFPRHSGTTAWAKAGLEAGAPRDRWQHPAVGSGLHIKGVAGAV